MLTVVLVGADGAGKSTVAARVVDDLPVPGRLVYLGANPDARTHQLPTTRTARWVRARHGRTQRAGGPPPLPQTLAVGRETSTAGGRSPRRGLRAAARTANQLAEEAYQEAVLAWHRAHGRVVVCDRHPHADHFAHDLSDRADRTRGRRVHGAFLARWVRPPDLVVVLDAEPGVLHARKGEGTLAELASRRAEYLRYARTVADAVVLDAGRPLDEVTADVRRAIVGRLGAPDATPAWSAP